MAEQGRGEVEYVSLNDDGTAAARRFHDRVRNPLLTDIAIDWGGLAVTDVYPKRLPDLFAAKPVVVTGRYTTPGRGVIRLRGRVAGRPFVREIPVDFPAAEAAHDVPATLWARSKVDDLMGQDWAGMQSGAPKPEVREAIVKLGLDYRLMTQYTSFVAVEEMTITERDKPRRIEVPVEMPEGVSYEGVFGIRGDVAVASVAAPAQMARLIGGVIGGVVNHAPAAPPAAREAWTLRAEVDARRGPAAKLHPSLAALVERLKKPGSRPAPEEAKLVRNGKAEIQVWLKDSSPPTLEALRRLGFEAVARPASGRVVIGRIPIEKLGALAALEPVVYVAPQNPLP
jgi:Ca-activated chloride channel homolog